MLHEQAIHYIPHTGDTLMQVIWYAPHVGNMVHSFVN